MSEQNAEVMRQFLVSLGFRVNEVQKRTFDDVVLKSDGVVKKLGATVLTTGVAAQAMVVALANSFEKLYYLSQRTGTSAADIKAAGAAGRQIGLNAATIESTINNISRAIKADPGTAALIEGLTGKSVQGRGIDKVLQDVVRSLSKYPDFFAFQMAGQIGIDPDTYLQLKNNLNEYIAAQERQKQLFADSGVDIDKSAEALKEYNKELAILGTKLELVGLKFADKMLPVFRELASMVGFVLDGMNKMMSSGSEPTTPKQFVEDATWSPFELGMEAGQKIRQWWSGGNTPSSKHRVTGKVIDEAPVKPSSGGAAPRAATTRGARNNNPGNIEYGAFARKYGATGSDGRFAIFPDMASGARAMAALLGSYQQRGVDTIDEIVERWAPSFENNTSAYKQFLAKRMGVGLGDKLTSRDIPALVSGIGLYESRVDPLSGGGVVIHQKNDIKVHGASDPYTTGKRVEDAMYQANADITRNLKGAVR